MKEKKNEIKFGAILGYVIMITQIIITFFYTPFMLSKMGQKEYGLYSLVASVVAYLSVLDMGFGNAMIRFISKSKANKNEYKEKKINGLFLILYSIIGLITVVIGLILLARINKIFPALDSNEIQKAKIIMAILVGTIAVSFPLSIFDSYVMACEEFKFLKVLKLIKTIALPMIMLPLLNRGYKSIAMVIVTCILDISYHLCTMICSYKKLDMKIDLKLDKYDKELFKEISAYSFFIFINIIVDTLFNNTDQVILGNVSGTVAVSIYAIAVKISTMNTTCSTTISGLFLPKITKMVENKKSMKEISDLFIKVSRIQMYIMVLISFGFICFGKPFIRLWVGEKYMEAYYIILLLMVPSIVPLTQNVGIAVIQAMNKHQFRSLVYLIIAILNVALSIPLAKMYGGIGAATGTAIASIIGQIIIMNIFYWKKIHLDIPKYWNVLSSFLIKVIPYSVIAYSINLHINFNWKKLILGAIIYCIGYGIIMYYSMNDEEKKYVLKIKDKVMKHN